MAQADEQQLCRSCDLELFFFFIESDQRAPVFIAEPENTVRLTGSVDGWTDAVGSSRRIFDTRSSADITASYDTKIKTTE